jgi:hypothetical protein
MAEYGNGAAAYEVIRDESDEAAFLLLVSKTPLEAISWVFGSTSSVNEQPTDEAMSYPLGRGHLRIAPGRLEQGTPTEAESPRPSRERKP